MIEISEIVKKLPVEEKYRIKSQIERSSASVGQISQKDIPVIILKIKLNVCILRAKKQEKHKIISGLWKLENMSTWINPPGFLLNIKV